MKRYLLFGYLLLGLLVACQDQATSPQYGARNVEDFEAAWQRINHVYPFFEFKKIDWDSIHTVYRPRVEAAEGLEFYAILDDLLAELKDAHVFYRTVLGETVIPWYSPRQIRDQNTFSLDVIQTYLPGELLATPGGTLHYGVLPDSIAYIHLADLEDSEIESEFPQIIAGMAGTKGLIFDLRNNNGGSIANITAVVSRFLSDPLPWPGYYFLSEPLPLDPVLPQGPYRYTGRVVLLINGTMISAAETSAEMLKHLPQVTLVGDTTCGGGGGASNTSVEMQGHYDLPSGLMINIPTGYGLRYDGAHIEWNGVPPDIRVTQTAADILNGVDRQLAFAITYIKR